MAARGQMERKPTASLIMVVSQPDSSPDATRVGITLAVNDKIPPSMEIVSRQNPLVNIIKDLCKKWKLDDPSLYQLQFDETKVQSPPIYITEENRDKMKDGDILKLDFSPQKMSKIMVDGFVGDNISKEKIDCLAKLSVDVTFVQQFVTQKCFVHLTKFILDVAKSRVLSQKSGSALSAFVDIMDHTIVSWETISEEFLDCILWYVESKTEADILVIKSSLEILESAILNSSIGKSFATEGRINIDQFICTLKTRDVGIQVMCISLINTILNVSSKEKQQQIRKKLLSQPTRQLVWENIFTGPIGNDMGYQLYSLQTRLSNLLSDRLNGAIKMKDPAAVKEISELRHIAFDDDAEASAAGGQQQSMIINETRDYTKLGFKNPAEPLMEFNQAPPGALALDCMAFFAHQYTQQYRQVVLENSRERADDQDCPFAQASVQLTQLLADILKIGEHPSGPPAQDDRTYYPMFFFKEKPFEECFCVCIQRLTRTWKEMKASLTDFNKVLMVVKEQITRALSEKPHTFDSLKTKLTNWSFAKIQEARQEELERKEEIKRQAKPIRELREMIRPEIEEVIRQQRINRMIDGCHFRPVKTTKTAKSVYCKLSQNGKVLHYGNSASDQNIPEVLQSINILDIFDIKESDDTKAKIKAIILVKQDKEEIQLIAENQRDHDVWLDGLHALTGLKPVNSEQAKSELDELLSMEVKLRLLDAEGISFPDDPPPIPLPPSNFNFVNA